MLKVLEVQCLKIGRCVHQMCIEQHYFQNTTYQVSMKMRVDEDEDEKELTAR